MILNDFLDLFELPGASRFHADADLRACITLPNAGPCPLPKIDADAIDCDAGVTLFLEVLCDCANHFRFLIVVAVGTPFGGKIRGYRSINNEKGKRGWGSGLGSGSDEPQPKPEPKPTIERILMAATSASSKSK